MKGILMMSWERVQTEIRDKIGVLAINYPPVNALGFQTIKELGEATDFFLKSKEVKVCIITGVGKHFVVGADIKELQNFTPETAGAFATLTTQVFSSIAYSKKPIICAINGMALGGGLELALACDIRMATEEAKLGFPEINLGLMPGAGGTQRLPRIVGIGRAKELIFTGRTLTAVEAFNLGIVEHVVHPTILMKEALKLAGTLANKSAVAIRVSKRAIMEGVEMPLERALELEEKLFIHLIGTEDKAEGVSAFLEKRSPKFKDR
jgi:enoyl-CoA hydratase